MYFIIGIIILTVTIILLQCARIRRKKVKMQRIRESFGAIPGKKFSEKNLRYLMDSEDVDYDIDDITWNDLNMDAVYSRINSCNSFIGEQVLYRDLHCTSPNKQKVEDREKFIERLNEDEEYRVMIQMLISKISKGMYCYYLPMFVKETDDFKINNIWIYRILTGILIGTLALGILRNQGFLYITGLIFITNIVLYTLKKQEFELHFGMLTSVLDVITVANALLTKEKIAEGVIVEESIEAVKRMNKVAKKLSRFQSKVEIARTGDPSGNAFHNYWF